MMPALLPIAVAWIALGIGLTAFLCGFHYAVREQDETAPTYGGLPR